MILDVFPVDFLNQSISHHVKLVPRPIVVCSYFRGFLGLLFLGVSISCWPLLLFLLFSHFCFVVFVAYSRKLLLQHNDKPLRLKDHPALCPRLKWIGVFSRGQTWTSGSPPVLSSSSFFFMSVSQLSRSLMKPSISSAFCRIWSCNSKALLLVDMVFPCKNTFYQLFGTLATVVYLKLVLESRGKQDKHAAML